MPTGLLNKDKDLLDSIARTALLVGTFQYAAKEKSPACACDGKGGACAHHAYVVEQVQAAEAALQRAAQALEKANAPKRQGMEIGTGACAIREQRGGASPLENRL